MRHSVPIWVVKGKRKANDYSIRIVTKAMLWNNTEFSSQGDIGREHIQIHNLNVKLLAAK